MKTAVIMSSEDAHFLAARLRRLCAHLNYALPKFAEDDAALICIAGSVLGALLTNMTHEEIPASQLTDAAESVRLERHVVIQGPSAEVGAGVQSTADLFTVEWLFANCRIVFFPKDGQYPVEHNPHAAGYDKTGENFKRNVQHTLGAQRNAGPRCSKCNDTGYVTYGDEDVPCLVCPDIAGAQPSQRPSREWYAEKIAESEGLDDNLPSGALADGTCPRGAIACQECGVPIEGGAAKCPRGGGRSCWVARQPSRVNPVDGLADWLRRMADHLVAEGGFQGGVEVADMIRWADALGVPVAPPPLPRETQQEQDADTLMRAAHFLREHSLTQIAWEVDAVRARIAGVEGKKNG